MAAMQTVGMTGRRHCRAGMAPNGQPSTGPIASPGGIVEWNQSSTGRTRWGRAARPTSFLEKSPAPRARFAEEAGHLARAGEAGASHSCQDRAGRQTHRHGAAISLDGDGDLKSSVEIEKRRRWRAAHSSKGD